MTRDALSRRTSGSAVLAAAVLLFLGACAETRPEPAELTDARLALQDARSAGAAQYAAEKLAAAQAHLATAESTFKADVDTAIHYARLADSEARTARYQAEARKARLALDIGAKRRAELEVAVRDAEIKAAERARFESEARAREERERSEAAASAREAVQRAADERVRELQARLDAAKRQADEQVAAARPQGDLLVRLQQIERSVRVEPRGIVLTLPSGVYFESGRSDVKSGARERFARIGQALAGASDRKILVEGYTDSTGSAELNMKLSELRAESVKAVLVENAVSPDRIETHGYASTKPVASNGTPMGRSQNRRVEVVVQGATPSPTPNSTPNSTPNASLSLDDLRWNFWAEPYSGGPNLQFQPGKKLLTGGLYTVVLDLSTIQYKAGTSAIEYSITPHLQTVLRAAGSIGAPFIDVALIPDRSYYDVTGPPIKPLQLELERLAQIAANGFAASIDASDLETMPTDPDPKFKLGRVSFTVHIRDHPGATSITLLILSHSRPIDELSYPVCVVRHITDACPAMLDPPSDAATRTFRVARSTTPSETAEPEATLSILAIPGERPVVVFRSRDAAGFGGDMYSWELTRSLPELQQRINEAVDVHFANAPQADMPQLLSFGETLHDLLFDSSDADAGDAALIRFTSRALHSPKPPLFFTRLLSPTGDTFFPIPFGLMTVIIGPRRVFLGSVAIVSSPLRREDYQPSSACLDKWIALIPGEHDGDAALKSARDLFASEADALKKATQVAVVAEDPLQFGRLMSGDVAFYASVAVLVLSHQDRNVLAFNNATPPRPPLMASSSIRREFLPPSIAVLGTCNSANPNSFDILDALNRHGVDAVIATLTQVDPVVTGRFLRALTGALIAHRGQTEYTLARGFFDASLEVAGGSPATPGVIRDPRGMLYYYFGNPNIRVCPPTPAAGNNQ